MSQTETTKVMPSNKQSGFTLIELAISLVILGILMGGAYQLLASDNAKAGSLYNKMENLGMAQERAKQDLGCYIGKFQGLFDGAQANILMSPAAADTAGNAGYCETRAAAAARLAAAWKGPYVKSEPVQGGELVMDDIAAGVDLKFGTVAADGTGGISRYYFVAAESVPEDMAKAFLNSCVQGYNEVTNTALDGTSLSAPATAFKKFKCYGDPTAGKVGYMYGQSR